MKHSRIRVGVVGLGGVARNNHIPALMEREDVFVAAGAERNPERGERVRELFGLPRVFQDFGEMYEQVPLDAVYVCLPPFLHLQAAHEAVGRGVHVLCEKPVGRSSQEAETLAEEATKRGVLFLPGFKLRWNPHFARAREILRSGILGRIIQVEATYMTPGPYISWDPKSEWYLDKANRGALSDIGSHLIDLLNYLLEPEVVSLSAVCTQGFIDYEVPTNISCMLRFADQGLGTMAFGWRAAEDILRFDFHGVTASLTVTKRRVEMLYKSTDPVDRIGMHLGHAAGEALGTWGKILDRVKGRKVGAEDRAMTADFVGAVRGAGSVRASGKDAVFAHRITEAIVESLERGGEVSLGG